jgi:uncharacterized protein YndB with AHSA1/START domain
MDDYGTYERQGDQTTLRYERRYPRPIHTVWAALTTPERLADWLGAAIVEPFVGGRFELFVDRPNASARMIGRVLRWDAPERLEFAWKVGDEPETIVRCELAQDGPNATHLVFTHGAMAFKWVGLVLPGWHSLFDRLARMLATGGPVPDNPERWRELQGIYIERYRLKDVLIEPPQGHCA